ncbi:hypothetical protein TOPH_01647 [Tolypocladium ophioglossoides CBS 100239]|uniref:Digeranylgeranylglyceryl phosphate synthase n=1 Tax=Tolypocladium ophioglossoides (strain CBS 100239) TaxID=1163406 RepID=A0A0L0NJ01_TOLOC|nr:hypothetical protein TOPH_01647 [Tolypocladium ophioglossoides CBS 100239]
MSKDARGAAAGATEGSSSSRGHPFFSLGVMPALMGLGHLAPVLAAIYTATGLVQFPPALLGMIGTAAALVDSYDTYKDVPLPQRPRKWVWNIWMCSLWAVVLVCTYYSGFQTAIQMYRFSFIGLCWGTPCIPVMSPASGFRLRLCKPKTVFREAKSLVVAVCMGYITADTGMFYFCHGKDAQCTEQSLRTRSLCLAVLYQFFRETACDIRDVDEDRRDGMKTLPVRMGRRGTLLLLTGLGLVLDALLTGGVSVASRGVQISNRLLVASVERVLICMGLYGQILEHPRDDYLVWGIMALGGLVFGGWAQMSLIE